MTTLPTIGTRIRYTGDRANPSGDGYAVRFVPADKYSPEGVDVALDDGRFWRVVFAAQFGNRPGDRFQVMDGQPIATPMECERRIRDEEMRQKHQKEQREGKAARRAELIAKGKEEMAKRLGGEPVAAIVAELMEDDSDSQTDYFASHATRTVVLAFSRHKRDLFSEMRKAGARSTIPEIRTLAAEGEEHREKWSMGHGYYIAGKRGQYSGWNIRKTYISDEVLEAMGRSAEEYEKAMGEPTPDERAPITPPKPAPIDSWSGIR
jgi:hypothetical protein